MYVYVHVVSVDVVRLHSPGGDGAAARLEGGGVTDHLVQHADQVGELGPGVAVLLPAVQHELMEHQGAVHGRGQPEVLLDGVDDLRGGERHTGAW